MNVFEFEVTNIKGDKVSLETYSGDVLLIMNTATHCGFTPEYTKLQELYAKYKDQGFVILDFPCNQFANQAPESAQEIATQCSVNYGVTFPIFAKIDVNGPNADPLFTYLKEKQKFVGFDMSHPLGAKLDEILAKTDPKYQLSSDIKWNFTKFLVDQKGEVVARFEPTMSISKIDDAIAKLLENK